MITLATFKKQTCVTTLLSEVVVNLSPLGKGSVFGYGMRSSFELSTGGVLKVKIFLGLQFAVTVMLSRARNVCPLKVSPTNEYKSKHKFSHVPKHNTANGNLACNVVTVMSFWLDEKNIRRLFCAWSVTLTPSSTENGRPVGINS